MNWKKFSKLWKKNIIGKNLVVVVKDCDSWIDQYDNKIDNPFSLGRASAYAIAPNRIILVQDKKVVVLYYKNFKLHGMLLEQRLI